MSYSCVYSAQSDINNTHKVSVETDISAGIHNYTIIGLPDKAVEEARDRVGAAIKNSGFISPKSQNQKITVSLAPADIKKEGPVFDLGIALSYLLSSGQVEFNPEGKIFVGELSLSGELRPVRGVLPIARNCKKLGITELFVPTANAREAALVEGLSVFGVESLTELIEHIDTKNKKIERKLLERTPITKLGGSASSLLIHTDFQDVRGQEIGKRALTIAAAGGHNIALFGPPGTGKTMLARALQGILPELSGEEIFEVASIHSVAGTLANEITTLPPWRAPHHTSSHVAIVGGGSTPRPGEITLAHHGVLFMDEFPEFETRVLESLREPLEEGRVSVSRARGKAIFPAKFILVAALNPCPCGHAGSPHKRCICSAGDLDRYRRKLSGPIMDRIDMWAEVSHLEYSDLHGTQKGGLSSREIKEKVIAVRDAQQERFWAAEKTYKYNSEISSKDLETLVPLSLEVRALLDTSAAKLELSPRVYYKIIKLARTIADIDMSETVTAMHILEALQYRPRIR